MTDLQQKIIHLEKQLEDANAALQTAPSVKHSRSSKHCKSGKQSITTAILESDTDHCTGGCTEHKGRSNVSFVFPAINTNTTPVNLSGDNTDISQGPDNPVKPNNMEHCFAQPAKPYTIDHSYTQPVKPYNMDNYYTQPIKPYNMNHYNTAPKISESKSNYQRPQTFLKKKKKMFKNKKAVSPYVYYAQTYSSPFILSNLPEEAPVHEENDTMTRPYLTDMISRQYRPEVLGDNMSLQTDFSSPICRDVQSRCERNCHIETDDVCSCCHGPYQNIDAHLNKQNTLQTYMVHQMNTGSAFYNTDQYDLVPVKEKPVKIKKDLDRPRKKEVKPYIDMKCYPENVRTKYRYQSCPLPTSNHYTVRPRADYTDQRQRRKTRDITDKLDRYARKVPATFNRTDTSILPKRRKCTRERSVTIDTSQSCCCIDFGNVYPKKTCQLPQKQESSQPTPIPKKNAECLTTVIDNHECQTEMSNMEVSSVDNKTEVTLNQIKSILQSVLAEVKVSSQTKGLIVQNKPKKDAVVQNCPSRNNMEASSLMNSFTYSPYAINPSPYVPSCSRQIRPNQFYPHGGMKCFHNFPVFIQTSARRNMCSSCYRSSYFKPGVMRQATTTATNTEEVKARHSRETDKLIKEIYKSMALTIDYPQKDTSLSEYHEPMQSTQGFTSPIILKTEPKKQPKIIRNVVQAVSELFMKKDMIETSDTFNSTVDSKSPSKEVSMRSHVVTSTDTELRARKERLEKYMLAKNKQPVVTEVKKKSFRGPMVQNDNSVSESESSSSEADSDTTLTQHKRVQDTSVQLEQKHVSIHALCEQTRCITFKTVLFL